MPYGNEIAVTEATSMRSTAVMASVRVIAETVASLPKPVYQRLKPRGKRRVSHSIGDLIGKSPNPYMTAFTFWETLMSHIMLWGNFYAEIEYDSAGSITALWPIPPHRVEHRETADGDPYFRLTLKSGKQKDIPFYAMLHVPGLSFDGRKGLSVIGWARQAVEVAIATENFAAEFFKNGTNVGAVVTTPSTLSDGAFDRLSKSLHSSYSGLGKAHKLMLLEEGMTFSKNTIPPNDAQFLETRKFQTLEIARIFRVPPHMLGDLERATFSNIEQQGIDFVTHTIRPWLVRIEQTVNMRLFGQDEQKKLFTEFLVEGLLRGETKARYEAYNIARNGGWLSVNEIRELENLNPIEGGDEYLRPLNMAEVGKPSEGGDNNNDNGQGNKGATGPLDAGNQAGDPESGGGTD
ncbi:phage portal protein [Saccharibacillus sacchari]|uniref:Phage portal protein n=1 Tax=Saccharibacillus sacchari TaxID=456493 RepID=A0ACC6PJJ1_9BACL